MPDTANKPEASALGYSQADWDEVDSPELTDTELADLRPVQEFAQLHALLPKRPRGRPRQEDAKVNFTLRISPALLDAYKATGEGWQVRMQLALKMALPVIVGSLPEAAPEQDGLSHRSEKRSA